MKALVLRKIPFSESDLVVSFLMESGEIQRGFAAGARNSKRRFPHQFSVDGLYNVDGLSTEKMNRIHRCELAKINSSMGRSSDSLFLWSQVSEWLLLNEHHRFDFEKVKMVWENLGEDHQEALFYAFFIQEMRTHGFEPRLNQCALCSLPLAEPISFSKDLGGFLHGKCKAGPEIPWETISFFERSLKGDLNDLLMNSAPLLPALRQMIIPFMEWHLGKEFKSWKAWNSMLEELSATSL